MKATDFEIIEMIGQCGERVAYASGKHEVLELNLVRYQSKLTAYDLRWWTEENRQPREGIFLTEKSLASLGELIDEAFKN